MSVTCLSDKYIAKQINIWPCFHCTRVQLYSWPWLIFFLPFFLLLQCLLFCYCNPIAEISVLSARGWKPRFQDTSFSATAFQCCGLCQGWWGGEARSSRPRGKGVRFPAVHMQRQDVAMFNLDSSWQQNLFHKISSITPGGSLKSHPEYYNSKKKHSEKSRYCVACWEHMMWKFM